MDAISMLAIKPMIDGIISKIVVPKLEILSTRIGLEYNKLLIPRGEHFSEYFYRTYKRYSIVNTLVFKNNQMLLKDIYTFNFVCREKFRKQKCKNQQLP